MVRVGAEKWTEGALVGLGWLPVSRPPDEIDVLADAIADLLEPVPPELSIGAPVWLPPRKPRALAVEVHDVDHRDGALAELQHAVAAAVSDAIDWQPENRRF